MPHNPVSIVNKHIQNTSPSLVTSKITSANAITINDWNTMIKS
jgi:hypothetical protein